MNNTTTNRTNEEIFWPAKIDILSVWLSGLSSIIAGFVGGLFIFLFTYLFLGGVQTSSIFPYILALVGFFAIYITISLTFVLIRLLSPDKYKQGTTVLVQMSIISIFLLILVLPIYIYVNAIKPDFIIFIFTLHILLNILASSLLSEILSSYRYILLGIYGSFIGFFVASFISVIFFLSFSPSKTALYSLMGVIIVINFIITVSRSLFEFVYYRIYMSTGTDYLGDIFSRIENEENELIEKAQKELERFE